jgi:hypothetical protein
MDSPTTGTVTCSTAAAPAVQLGVTGRPFSNETPNTIGRQQDIMSSTIKVSDDHGNHRLSAVRNGPAAGLGEMGPRETTFTNVDPAANGEMGPHEEFNTSAVPNPLATMDEDRVPLRDQGTPLQSPGQYSPDNTTIPHAQAELFVIHGSMSVCADEEDS